MKSTQAIFLPFAGKPLVSRQLCFWKVRIRDQRGRGSDWSANVACTMGLLSESDWRGQWSASNLELMCAAGFWHGTGKGSLDLEQENPEDDCCRGFRWVWPLDEIFGRIRTPANSFPALARFGLLPHAG